MSRASAFKFLCDCLAWTEGANEPQPPRRGARPEAFSWTSFAATAFEYEVASATAVALRKLELSDPLPQGLIDYFDGLAASVRAENAHVRAQAIELAQALNRIQVRQTPRMNDCGPANLFTTWEPMNPPAPRTRMFVTSPTAGSNIT